MNDELLAAIVDTRDQVSALSKQQDCLMEMIMRLDERLTALELCSKAETAAELVTKLDGGSTGGDAGRTAALVQSKTDGTDDKDDARATSASSEPVPVALDRILQEVLKVQKHLLAKKQ
jgi:phage shock protein A